MKKVRNITICAIIILLLAALLTVTVSAEDAGEGLFYGECELLQEGGFPSPPEVESPTDSRALTNKQQAEAAIIAGLESSAETIDLAAYGLLVSEFKDFYSGILNSNPQLFYVKGAWYTGHNGTNVLSVTPQYLLSGAELAAAKAEYDGYVAEIIALVDPSWEPIEKALFLHDYLAANYEYDTALIIRDAYTFFKDKKGVCQSYTLAYIALLNELNVPVSFATSDSINHIWNVVQIGASWYHVDVTWDDPTPNMPGRVCHTNFLLSDTEISKSHKPENGAAKYECSYSCGNATYDSFYWQNITAAFVPIGESWYYLSYSPTTLEIRKTADPTSPGNSVEDISAAWGYYVHFSGLSGYCGQLIYNTPTGVYYYNPDSDTVSEIFTPTLSGNKIYGSTLTGNTLYYALAASPNVVGEKHGMTLTPPVTLTKIEINTPPDITVYASGETLDTTGLSLLLTYSNGSTDIVRSGFKVDPTPLFIGEIQRTVIYGENSTAFSVSVSITVKAPLKLTGNADCPVILFSDGQVLLKKDAKTDDTATFFCAAYDGSGKLTGVCSLSGETLSRQYAQIPNSATAAKFKIFALDSSNAPTGEAAVYNRNSN